MSLYTNIGAQREYENLNKIDFSIIGSRLRSLPFFEDDTYLSMQGINVGIADPVITHYEYALLKEQFETEKTPVEMAMAVSALSQMWIYGLYEVLRLWRDRKFQFEKLHKNGGIELKIKSLSDDDPLNHTIEIRKKQLMRYKANVEYRDLIAKTWMRIEGVYRSVELYRINLAKHCAPGKDGAHPRAPGYGRINRYCGAMDYELLDKDGAYRIMNRRDVADSLRTSIIYN